MEDLREIYRYREMIFSLVRKDLRTRYKGTVLGFLWTFMNPLLQLIVYSIVFSFVMRVQLTSYYMFMFVGLLPWIFFCTCLQGGATSVVSNADLIKKIYFPRIVLPISMVSAAFMNMIFSMIIMFLGLEVSGIGVSNSLLYFPLLIILLYGLGLGFSFIFSALNVYFRDLEHILGILLMCLFYATPIIYPLELIPPKYLVWLKFNPMLHMIKAFQDVLYYKRDPEVQTLIVIMLLSLAFIIIGYFVFQKLERNFVEEL